MRGQLGGTIVNPNGGLIGGGGMASDFGAGDIVLKKRLFGAPFQFLPTTDARPETGSDNELGVAYTEMMAEAAIFSIIPGKPSFLPDLDEQQKQDVITSFNTMIGDMGSRISDVAGSALQSQNMDVRYFEFTPDSSTYMRYVNTLCQMNAIMMGIGDEYLPGFEGAGDDYLLKHYDWSRYRLSNLMAGRATNGIGAKSLADSAGDIGAKIWDAYTQQGVSDALSTGLSSLNLEEYFLDFYVDPAINYSETFNNQTKESMVASMISNASEWAKELSFLMSSGAISSDNYNKSNETFAKELNAAGMKLGGGKNFISRFMSGASSIISGANIAFPQMWMNSDHSRNYSIEMHLRAPYGNKMCIYLNEFVPLWHWIALTAPRQSTINTYSAPFIIRGYMPGIFSTEMGIVETLNIKKGGANGDAYSVDGYPLEIDLSIGIRDLYETFSLSKIHTKTDAYNMLWNHALIDYVSVQSGLDMKQSEASKKIAVAKALAENAVTDWIQFPQDKIRENLCRGWRVMGGKN